MTFRKIDGCGFIDECPFFWNALEPTDKPDKRLCRTCDKFVHVCDNPLLFELYAKAGACVAVPDPDHASYYLGGAKGPYEVAPVLTWD